MKKFLLIDNEATKNIKLAVNRSSLDIGCDQGYGSERSPEDDFPPILSILHNSFRTHLQTNQDLKKDADKINENDFPFIKEGLYIIINRPFLDYENIETGREIVLSKNRTCSRL